MGFYIIIQLKKTVFYCNVNANFLFDVFSHNVHQIPLSPMCVNNAHIWHTVHIWYEMQIDVSTYTKKIISSWCEQWLIWSKVVYRIFTIVSLAKLKSLNKQLVLHDKAPYFLTDLEVIKYLGTARIFWYGP